MQISTIDLTKLRGVGDKFIGLVKETTGVLLGNDWLQKAGEAQQEKATEKLKALRDEAKAEGQEKKADSIRRANPRSGGSGALAEVKGRVKQTAGSVVGDSELQKEGQADEERGAAGREATKNRASAKAHDTRAKAAEKAEDTADARA
jgi:uncharacterized protein YjbJ (UPF0337 family)